MHALSGYEHIVSTDLSPTLIEKMRERALEQRLPPSLSWEVGDFTALPFEPGSFDVVIEKGAIDCLLTTVRDPWNLPEAEAALCRSVLEESHRVLRPDGVFLSITFSAPHFRRPMLYGGRFSWRVQCETFGEGDSLHYHLYACRKGQKGLDEAGEEERRSEYVPAETMAHDFMDDPDECLLRMGGAVSDADDDLHLAL